MPFLGSLVEFDREPTPLERDLTLAICVDAVIGLRPYVDAMR